ncbi:MAG: T9SS type A sorting domain-containing protein, partial [Candidatus Eisenbacteria bacterium]|nr:T9SS type A sorting domain-containing protein [Candidatus Eisenbacteria bacterium]
ETLTSTGGYDMFLAKLGENTSGIEGEAALTGPQWTASGAWPNPSHGAVSIRLHKSNSGHTSVAIYDVTGRLVRALLERELGPGGHDIVWDGRDGSGRRVAAGSYVLRIQSREIVAARRVVRVE